MDRATSGASGLAGCFDSTRRGDRLDITIHDVTSQKRIDEVIGRLNELYTRYGDDLDWRIDLSEQAFLPMQFVNGILAIGREVKNRDRRFELVGMETRRLPCELVQAVKMHMPTTDESR